jgi:hypothetical protein
LGILGGFVLLSSATFALNAPTQYADVPLSFFFLSTFVLLLLADAGRAETMALAGFTAGCAAWTKDEGIVFAAMMATALLLCTLLSKLSVRRFAQFAAGALVPIAVTIYFKAELASGPGTWSSLTLESALNQIAQPARYAQILSAFWGETKTMGVSLIALALLAGLLGLQSRGPLTRAALGVCVLMLAGDFAIYVVTPFDLAWHLSTSLGRLLTQLVPSATFLVAVCCRTPEEIAPAPHPKAPEHPRRKNR